MIFGSITDVANSQMVRKAKETALKELMNEDGIVIIGVKNHD